VFRQYFETGIFDEDNKITVKIGAMKRLLSVVGLPLEHETKITL